MRTGMKMTIQDYFKRSGIHNASAQRLDGKHAAPIEREGSFSRALAAVQSSDGTGPDHRGLSIQDYVARPVPSRFIGGPCPAAPVSPTVHIAPAGDVPPKSIDSPPASNFVEPGAPMQQNPTTEKEKILASIDQAAEKYDLSKSLIRAVVKAESAYQVRAVSPAGAQGLMQLMPATARELGVEDPFDIDQNINGGAKYLRQMLDRFDGNIKVALSAYNAGPDTVSKYNGNVPYSETRNYIERVMRYSREFS